MRKLTEKREKYFLTDAEIETLKKTIDLDRVLKFLKDEKVVEGKVTWDKIPLYRPKSGLDPDEAFSGRVGIYEVLKMSSAIKELVMQGKTDKEIEKRAKEEGMLTMIEDGMFKVVQGQTTIEEILRVVSE